VTPLLLLLLLGAQDRLEARIAADVASDLAELSVAVDALYTPATPLEEIGILLAADRYAAPPQGLWAPAVRQVYPAVFGGGGWTDVAVEGCTPRVEQLAGGETLLWCPARAAAGEPVRVHVEGRLRVPERYGPFGRHGGELTLAGGWAPTLVRSATLSPPRGRQQVRIAAPSRMSALIGDRYLPAVDGPERRTLEVVLEDVAQVSLLLRPSSVRALPIAGGRARYLVGPASGLPPEADQLRAAVADGLSFLAEEGLPLPSPAHPLVLARAALRHDLAHAAERVVLISDRAFRMVDVDRFLRFHRFPILREVFLERLLALLSARLGTAERLLAADAIAAWLVDRYVASRFGRAENAFDVLGPLGFIPSVDSMLYAPDLAFVGAYFRLADESDPLRDDLIAAPSPFPRGKRIYDKLVDEIGPGATALAFQRVLAGQDFLEQVALALGGGTRAERFLATWLGAYPKVSYQLGRFESRPSPRCARCVDASAEVLRSGTAIAEPVPVLFIDEDGGEALRVAPASPGSLRTVSATLAAPLASVEIDPYGRLAEVSNELQHSPRFDNRSSQPWTVLLNNFNVLLSGSGAGGSIDTALDLGFKRAYDVRWRYGIRAAYGQEAVSGSVRASYSFGEEVTPAVLDQSLTLIAAADYLRPGFADEQASGLAGDLTLHYLYDDRPSYWAPSAGTAVRLTLDWSHVFGALPAQAPGSPALTHDAVGATIKGIHQWMIALGHQISLHGALSAYLTGEPRAQLLFPLGGRYQVRGYAENDKDNLGKIRAIAGAEWLHPLIADLDFNGLWWFRFTGIDGALFGDAALLANTPEELVKGPLLGDIGYGLRFYVDYGGVRPGVMAIDAAMPLAAPRGAPHLGGPTLYIDFSQSFYVF
jgi:hypothetical protein